MEREEAFASELEAQSSSKLIFENNTTFDYKNSSNSNRNQETRAQKMEMMEENSEEEEPTGGGELNKDQLKSLMMSQLKIQTKNQSGDANSSKRNHSRGKNDSSNDHSKDKKGPYLEKIEIRAPQEWFKEDDKRGHSNLNELFKASNPRNSNKFFQKNTENASKTTNSRSFEDETHSQGQSALNKLKGIHKGTIINELDQKFTQQSTLFGQKVDLNKLLIQQAQPEPDPMLSIFQRQIDQELTETEEIMKKEKLKDRLDKLRSLVSKPGVDYSLQVSITANCQFIFDSQASHSSKKLVS